MSNARSLPNFFFFCLHEKPTDQCFSFGTIPPGALQRKMGGSPWNQPLCLYSYTLNDFSLQSTVLWETEYKKTFILAILLAIVKECGHCVPGKVFLEVIEENFSVAIP